MESTLTTSPPSESAMSTARSDLPAAVGPTTATTGGTDTPAIFAGRLVRVAAARTWSPHPDRSEGWGGRRVEPAVDEWREVLPGRLLRPRGEVVTIDVLSGMVGCPVLDEVGERVVADLLPD